EGVGVSFWASPVEAKLVEGKEVAVVGGGNSAGQAVVYLAPRGERLHLVVRGPGLPESMSQYLRDRIPSPPPVEVHARTEVAELGGDRVKGLTSALLRSRDGATRTVALHHLFLFIGADPNADWLDAKARKDSRGFLLTGPGAVEAGGGAPRVPL